MNEPRDIDDILSEIVTLPSLPLTITRLLELLDDPSGSMQEVGQVVSTDPGIALKTLRLVNSAQYGTRNKVTSVEQAVVMLGGKVIKNLVLSAVAFEHLGKGTDQFLTHCISCGVAMELLSGQAKGVEITPDEAFVFGVLHDIGIIIFEEFMPQKHAKATDIAIRRGVPLFLAEREVIGVDHATLGSRLAANWRLPAGLVNAIAGHHDFAQCTDRQHKPLAALMAAGDYICNAAGLTAGPCPVPGIPERTWTLLGLTGADLPHVLDSFFAALPNIDELVEITES